MAEKGYPINAIVEITGLSTEEVRKIIDAPKDNQN